MVATPVAAATVDPNFQASVPDPIVTPGTEVVLTIQVVNDAEDASDTARTAQQVQAIMASGDSPFSIRSGSILAGDMPDGQFKELQFRVVVPRNASAGIYQVPISLTFEYGNSEGTQTVYVPIRVESIARFSTEAATTTASIGDTGMLRLTLRNIGDEAASDARIVVRSTDSELTFGAGGTSSDGFVGQWAPGDQAGRVQDAFR